MPAFVTLNDGSLYKIDRLTSRPSKNNAKLTKNDKIGGYTTIGLSLLPAKLSGFQVCPHSTAACRELCINYSGRTMMGGATTDRIMKAREARTLLFFQDREKFFEMLYKEVNDSAKTAARKRNILAVRLNVFSDINYMKLFPKLILDNPQVIFYNYSKNPFVMEKYINGEYPKNYYITFSRSEENEEKCLEFLSRGGNVAAVFDVQYSSTSKQPLPKTWRGFKVIDGDISDLRHLDPIGKKNGYVIGLRAKGFARRPKHKNNNFIIKVRKNK